MKRLELDDLRELLALAIESKDTVADIILDFISRVYESGYVKGLHKGYKEGLNEVNAYQVGLTYGWECALNIHYMSEEKVIAIFGGRSKWAECTVSQALTKIKEYEEKQIEKSYRDNKYYNTFPTSKETADEIKAEYDEETRSYSYTVKGEAE